MLTNVNIRDNDRGHIFNRKNTLVIRLYIKLLK